jgi:hypothetical protein
MKSANQLWQYNNHAEEVISPKFTVLLIISQVIELNKKLYYNSFEQAQKRNEITNWIIYFVNTIIYAKADKNINKPYAKQSKVFIIDSKINLMKGN